MINLKSLKSMLQEVNSETASEQFIAFVNIVEDKKNDYLDYEYTLAPNRKAIALKRLIKFTDIIDVTIEQIFKDKRFFVKSVQIRSKESAIFELVSTTGDTEIPHLYFYAGGTDESGINVLNAPTVAQIDDIIKEIEIVKANTGLTGRDLIQAFETFESRQQGKYDIVDFEVIGLANVTQELMIDNLLIKAGHWSIKGLSHQPERGYQLCSTDRDETIALSQAHFEVLVSLIGNDIIMREG